MNPLCPYFLLLFFLLQLLGLRVYHPMLLRMSGFLFFCAGCKGTMSALLHGGWADLHLWCIMSGVLVLGYHYLVS